MVGFAARHICRICHTGIDEPHLLINTNEIYLIARESAKIRIESQTVKLSTGQMLLLEPGEAHRFLSYSPDYFHFVLHIPDITADQAMPDKNLVSRERLGI